MDLDLTTYNRLFDICDVNYMEVNILIYSYARKRTPRNPKSVWMEGRIGLSITKLDKKNKRVPVSTWQQMEPGNPPLEKLAASALTFLERNGLIQ